MRAVITGAAGFVGRHLAIHLAEEGDVVAVDRDFDVTNLEAMSGVFSSFNPDAIYHLAALSHVGSSWDDPSEVLRVNVVGTSNVLAAARQATPRASVLVISSAEVYGAVQPEELPLTEAWKLAELPIRRVQGRRRAGGTAGGIGLRAASAHRSPFQPHRAWPVALVLRAGGGAPPRRGPVLGGARGVGRQALGAT